MTFDELLQKRHVVQADVPPKPKRAKQRHHPNYFAEGAVYRINCPDGLIDYMHGYYVLITEITEARIYFNYLTPEEHHGECDSCQHSSYFADCLDYAASSHNEYIALQAM